MQQTYSASFKINAVKKALSRPEGTSLVSIARSLGVSKSALHSWTQKAQLHTLEPYTEFESNHMTTEKRPQDLNLQERLDIIIACSTLDEQGVSELCRQKGLYPHHVEQWKLDFVGQPSVSTASEARAEVKSLKAENKALAKELNRKEKALAETAALLVLQKKFNILMGDDEENSQ